MPSETQYGALNRVLFSIQKGAIPAEDLITEQRYTVFGDLLQTVLPRGNVLEYGYDLVGRLVSIERKPDDLPGSHIERTFYTLDGFGHRVREELRSCDGASWVSDFNTEYVYSSRCHLDKTIEGAGSPEQALTEFSYDSDGDLEQIWDANHPSAGQTALPSTAYAYDPLDRLSTVSQPFGGAGGGQAITTHGYDVQDHLITLTDAEGTVTSYVYSDRDLLTQETSEVSGLTTNRYNEHGQLIESTDARNITTLRTIDELDRVALVDYPDDTLDVTYAYDDPLVTFSLGRLTQITRDGFPIAYEYDRFGRTTRDGDLAYAYDLNSNKSEILYPGGMKALYAFDHADRQLTLDAEIPGQGIQSVVTGATYNPIGPLRQLTRGNGIVETRPYDSRYQPERITAVGPGGTLLDWEYSTDGVGNISAIADLQDAANSRTYGHQDYQYFLTQGDGPWGLQVWTYDKIGNRLSETRNGLTDIYTYHVNTSGSGNTAKLDLISLNAGGSRIYNFDASGNQIGIDEDSDPITYTYDDAGRLKAIDHASAQATSTMLYDGRSLLRQVTRSRPFADGSALFCDGFESGDTTGWSNSDTGKGEAGQGAGACFETVTTTPSYSSGGTLQGRNGFKGSAVIVYFAGHPTAQIEGSSSTHLTLDHLGTPILATDNGGSQAWSGGFEPFGQDYVGASDNGISLRSPGQWQDDSWGTGIDIYYNVYRWYNVGAGRYTRTDPLGLLPPERSALNLFSFALANPTAYFDPLGLDAITDDTGIRKCIYCIFKKAGFGMKGTEEAFWATCKDGKLGCSLWPSSAKSGTTTRSTTSFRGRIPEGACGIFHTHPRKKPGPPSSCTGCDEDVSRRRGIPIYTVHPSGIWKFDPHSGKTTLEVPSGWSKDFRKQCGKRPCEGL